MEQTTLLAVEHMLNNDLDFVSITSSITIMRSGNVLFSNRYIGTIVI